MRRWKSFIVLLVITVLVVGIAVFIRRLSEPRPSEIERLFDGTEAVFMEGTGLLSAWKILCTSDYWQSRTYEGFGELPPLRRLLDTAGSNGTAWVGRINVDTVMSAVGNEAALGIYTGKDPARFLFVSRVDPNFLLVDRLLAFAGADAGIEVSSYRGMRVKEATLDGRGTLLWALDGDLLLFSNDKETLFAAIDRHIDKTTGGIVSNRSFIRLKKDRRPPRLISGYAVTDRLAPGALPDAVRALVPEALFFSASYADGLLTLAAEGARGVDLLSLFSRRRAPELSSLPDGVVSAVTVGRMPFDSGDPPDRPDAGAGLPGLLPYLFPDGFSAVILSDPQCIGGAGMIATAETGPSVEAAIDRLVSSGMTVRNETKAGVDITIVEKDSVVYLALARRDGRVFISDRPELLVGMSPETLEIGNSLGYTTSDGEITLALSPRPIYRELERCGRPVPVPSIALSLDQQKRLSAALYPIERIVGYASIGTHALVITIAIYVEDAIP